MGSVVAEDSWSVGAGCKPVVAVVVLAGPLTVYKEAQLLVVENNRCK